MIKPVVGQRKTGDVVLAGGARIPESAQRRAMSVLVLATSLFLTAAVLVAPEPADATSKSRSRILFVGAAGRADGQIVVLNPNTMRRRQFTSGPGRAESPRWSPWGKRILYKHYASEDQLNANLMVMGAGGRHEKRLITGGRRYTIEDMAWGPAGRRIALTMTIGQGNSAISGVFIFSMRTRKLTRLPIDIPNRRPRTLDWSRDGRRIVFEGLEYNDGTPFDGANLYVVRANGTGLHRITQPRAGVFDLKPRWSPDGRRLVFSRENENEGCDSSLIVVSANGTNPHRVPLRRCGPNMGTWSPTGSRLLAEYFDGHRLVALSTAVDGSYRRVIVRDATTPSWRPR